MLDDEPGFLRACLFEGANAERLRAEVEARVLAPRRERIRAALAAHLGGRAGDGLHRLAESLEALTLDRVVARDEEVRRRDPAPQVRALCRGIRAC